MHGQSLFRPAPARSKRAYLLWTAAECAVIWPLFLVILPMAIVAVERRAGVSGFQFRQQSIVAVTLFLLFSALNVTTGATLALRGQGTPLPLAGPRSFVVAGPYRYIRNPMALAGIGQGFSVGLWLGSWSVLLYSIAGALFWHILLRPVEEKELFSRFGRVYEMYRREVPLWLPRAKAYAVSVTAPIEERPRA